MIEAGKMALVILGLMLACVAATAAIAVIEYKWPGTFPMEGD